MKTDEIFFRDVLSEIEIKGISKLIVVSHLNRQIDPFFDALSQKIQIAGALLAFIFLGEKLGRGDIFFISMFFLFSSSLFFY